MKTRCKKILTLLLGLALLLSAMPVSAGAEDAVSFPDVPANAWYRTELNKIMEIQALFGVNNIITGYPDGSFRPDGNVKRGEFLKMLFEASESCGNETAILEAGAVKPGDHWAEKYYLKAKADNALIADVYSSTQPIFSGSKADLDQDITRYEMAIILNNVCTNIAMQPTVVTTKPEGHITDYALIPVSYRTAVEQSYGKGLLKGNEKGIFNGNNVLTRGEAVTVIYRYLFVDTIRGDGLQSWASLPEDETTSDYLDPSLSFANRLRANGGVDAYGNLAAWAKMELFGTTSVSYFSSAAAAANHMTTVSVPIWTMDKAGNKIASTCSIVVNKAVAEEVKSIFRMIYDDPEKFPIYGGWSAGGARYSDTLRHSWGCAIDINAYYNCECDFRGGNGALRVTCGYGWWPIGHSDRTYAGSMTAQSAYSIGCREGEYGYSVVKAFATYGWGWGGQGYSSGKHDFMHFSVLPSGG